MRLTGLLRSPSSGGLRPPVTWSSSLCLSVPRGANLQDGSRSGNSPHPTPRQGPPQPSDRNVCRALSLVVRRLSTCSPVPVHNSPLRSSGIAGAEEETRLGVVCPGSVQTVSKVSGDRFPTTCDGVGLCPGREECKSSCIFFQTSGIPAPNPYSASVASCLRDSTGNPVTTPPAHLPRPSCGVPVCS